MKRFLLVSAILLASVAVSCDQLPDQGDELVAGTKLIKVDPVRSDYESKAASSPFFKGESIGLYVFTDETWLDNAEYVSDGSTFTSNTDNYWYEDDELISTLFSYCPYSSANKGKNSSLEFSIKADQSTQEVFMSSDVMYAFATSVPTDEPVRLPFKHVLSKLVIYIENNIGEDITDVSLENLYTSVTVSMKEAGKIAPKGARSSVRFAHVKISGKDAWVAVLVPEKGMAPSMKITLASGETVEYLVENPFDLESGFSHTASVTLNPKEEPDVPVSVTFDMSVNDWGTGEDMIFVKEEEENTDEWNYLGVGSFIDDIMTVYSIPSYEMFVKIYEKADTPGLYRIEDPYRDWPYMNVFTSTGSGNIIIDASDPEKVYMRESDLCLTYDGKNHIAGSICAENGFESSIYGNSYIDDTYAYIWFPTNSLYLTIGQTYGVNSHGRTVITLPGYARPALYGYQYLDYNGEYLNEEGVSCASFTVYSEFDNPNARVSLLEGRVEDIEAVVKELIDGKIPSYDASSIISPGMRSGFYISVPESGTYTAVVYTSLPDGGYYYYYRYFSHQVSGEAVPECDFKLNYLKAYDRYPEGTMEFNFSCSDFHEIQFALYESELLTGLADEELEIMVTKDGNVSNIYYEGLESSEGLSYYIPHLEPDTDYTLLVNAYTTFGHSVFAKASARTASEPKYTYLDKGKYYDNFFELGGNYSTDVDIYVSEDDPYKFRVMDPYKNYWKNPAEGVVGSEPEVNHFDVYIDEYDGVDYVYYSYIHTGSDVYIERDDVWGEIVYDQWYWTTRRDFMASTFNCKMIGDGLLQIAPCANIFGTGWYYDGRDDNELIVLALPGAEYNPDRLQKSRGIKSPEYARTEMKKMVSVPVIKELGTYPSYKSVEIKEIKKVENNKLNIL